MSQLRDVFIVTNPYHRNTKKMQALARSAVGGASIVGPAARRSAAGAVATAARREYHENIVDHYENPRNVGSLDKNDKFVGTVSP